ncbi:transporter substrate-binding domain-containing protein [Thalassotalea sp. 1_MG-2023]|uniref:substrate-binding periplasmic protein n=1 Tax=Thalassotalea sp. 1_MG-2023 TaxID=3062680 RepID=UPI0026E28F4F|nr:transporter substrate-binding domain-containing protein [Thalassotalea sp. 1_MG-2023]MDO6427717.1 transporter substrate-binding domain-containing protein [Thalassotalea sp. 1_MG-2023]
MERLIYFFLSVYIFIGDAYGQSESLRVIGVDEPPASYLADNGQAEGYVVDIVKALLAELNISTKIQISPEARVLNIAKNNANILLFSFSRTAFREHSFHWIGKVLTKKWQAFTTIDNTLEINSLQDLRQISNIGVVRGDVREEWLINRGFNNLYSVTYPAQNVRLLAKKRLPVIVYEQQGLSYICRQLGIENEFKSIFTVHQADVYLLMSKRTSPEVVANVTKAFYRLKQSGKLREISENWYSKLALLYPNMHVIEEDFISF